MEKFDIKELKKLYVAKNHSHKGENGKLLIIAGSILFHAASLWPLEVASRIVDMVFYSSVSLNNRIVEKNKDKFRNGIVIEREKIEDYIDESDCILIGPGLPRENGLEKDDDDTKTLTESLLRKYPNKKWVIDGGSLQVIDPSIIPSNSIITPHGKEFTMLFNKKPTPEAVFEEAKKFNITILLKGEKDIVCNNKRCVAVEGGNAGMTKGGTGDVLAGLVASFYCKNNAFLSASAGSFINKKAGESLYQKVGPYFNASDLSNEIPYVLKHLVIG
jgi:hydroxyethylthiazole kinase-like uncharacterized protein yjeF